MNCCIHRTKIKIDEEWHQTTGAVAICIWNRTEKMVNLVDTQTVAEKMQFHLAKDSQGPSLSSIPLPVLFKNYSDNWSVEIWCWNYEFVAGNLCKGDSS